jgi:hypothetical protein
MNLQPIAPVLLALQFAAFGWRINREISVGDQGRRTWLPLADAINIVSMIGVVALSIVWPLAIGDFDRLAKTMVSVGYTLIAFHPVNTAAHYRLFSPSGRGIYTRALRDYPYITDQEVITLLLSFVAAIGAGMWMWHMS